MSKEAECWKILTDTALIKFTKVVDIETKKARLGMTIEKALAEGLHTESAICVRPESRVDEVVDQMQHLPILVTDATKESRLLGIITAFDLL
jgi:CBS domain-containing protein